MLGSHKLPEDIQLPVNLRWCRWPGKPLSILLSARPYFAWRRERSQFIQSRLFPTQLSTNPVQAIPNPVQQPRPGYSQPCPATPSRLFPTLSSNPVQAIPNPAQHQPCPGYSQPRPATPSRLFPTLSSNPVQAIPNPVQQPRPGYSQPSSAPTPSRLFPTLSSNPVQAIPNPVHDMKLRKGLHKPTSIILNSIRQATSISVVACGALSALWRLTAHLSGRRRKQQGRASSL